MWMLTVLLQKQPKYPSATDLVKDYTSQWTIWLTEQQSAAITCNTADKTHRTVRKSSQVQRPHTEFIYIEYKTVQCIYGTYSLDNGNLWWGSSQRGVRGSPGVQGSPHPTLWSRCRWHRCTLGELRDFLWLHLLWYCSHKNHWIHEEARRAPPHSFLISQSETGHCTPASAVATIEKQSKQMPTFKKRRLHHPVITWSCEPVHCFLSLSSFLFPCPPDSPGPGPCAVRVSRWQEKKERQQ